MRRDVLSALIIVLSGFASRDCCASSSAADPSFEFVVGVGSTYHYWAETGSEVLTGAGVFGNGRYEVSLFRMTGKQTEFEAGWSAPHTMAEPYWGISASRRWQLFSRAHWRLLFGFGISYKTEEDSLNSTHWNFASQLGIRVHQPSPGRPAVELWIRHWSNAGTRLPNRGQDFLTVGLVF